MTDVKTDGAQDFLEGWLHGELIPTFNMDALEFRPNEYSEFYIVLFHLARELGTMQKQIVGQCFLTGP